MTTLREVLTEARARFESDLLALDTKYRADRAAVMNQLDKVALHADAFKNRLEEDVEKVKSEATISFDWLKSKL